MTHSNPQSAHYLAIHDDYQSHYFDASSQAYRERFIYAPLFKGQNLTGKKMAELACGGGDNATYVTRFRPECIDGFDISQSACDAFKSKMGGAAYCLDLTQPLPPGLKTYDALYVIGGMHHCVLNLPQTLDNAATLLNPGGVLLVMEPHAGFFLQAVRDFWYERDHYFDHGSERALLPQELATPQLKLEKVRYIGGPAYFLVINSMILRIPLWLKPWISKALFLVEAIYNHLPGRWFFPTFVASYRRI